MTEWAKDIKAQQEYAQYLAREKRFGIAATYTDTLGRKRTTKQVASCSANSEIRNMMGAIVVLKHSCRNQTQQEAVNALGNLLIKSVKDEYALRYGLSFPPEVEGYLFSRGKYRCKECKAVKDTPHRDDCYFGQGASVL